MRSKVLSIALVALLAACSQPSRSSAQQTPRGALPGPPLPSAARRAPTDAGQVKLSYAPVVKKTQQAVVNISSKRVVRQVDPFFEMFGMGVPRARVEGSLGSGVIVRSDGIIVTNNHVIEGGQEITVSLSDRREYPAKILLADPKADLAVLKIEANDLPTLAISSGEDLQVGDLVLAIGDPFGVGQTVTNGIISALNRTDVGASSVASFIQTDAAINPGNSGGALVDMDGNLIGVNSMILSRSGGSQGIGFAIPGPVVRQVVDTALGGGKVVSRPWLGVAGQPVTSDIAKSLGLDRPQGVLLASVYPGSAAARAGLQQGDAVLSVDGQPIDDETSLNYRIGTRKPGETVTLGYQRGGSAHSTRVTVEAPPSKPRDEQLVQGENPFDGAVVLNLSPATALDLNVDPFRSGVVISEIRGGLSVNAGVRPGDLIKQVNGKKIATVADLRAALQDRTRTWSIVIDRNGQQIAATFQS
ncbi:MAG TPA: Do family serine endopeptidase [Caulobacteraceae bacterium]|jgi:Do/DeqQ family serine protease